MSDRQRGKAQDKSKGRGRSRGTHHTRYSILPSFSFSMATRFSPYTLWPISKLRVTRASSLPLAMNTPYTMHSAPAHTLGADETPAANRPNARTA